ncbi:UbiH, 2-polyprenyl-6-methoxyphenol hydroxylase and related FAD-dependent oxidoreductase [Pyrenophora tritici-repentis]|uniref:UbiH, 2-polyprenyl-6-methoxyphenol hydroxylase and related FAD-dependent oxidoreductase n=1 Tax=Pyrenophora tritici-repentis TaxID=45151 RepID=A0A317AII3_9PLEO|nr:FAD/NAD-binding domain-containing protein [Pyrenophora tritici-repentis]KAF7574230.1 UbiH, 2-polyprenyl-6-methoxyphenol hydroxylase and related FAD-dependent oxidoreductase [Pyrenophora tritici-repentis]
MTKPIPIIGAGIAGLTLGRCFLHRGIPFVLYEKASSKPRNNYAITLHASAYRPLLSVLGIDEVTFKRRVAVDGETGGTGTIAQEVHLPNHNGLYDTSSSFRANRAKFEQVLQQGLEIQWEHTLQSVETTPEGAKLQFHNGSSCSAKLAVAADGVHSSVRKLLLPSAAVEILPYAVFNGKRKTDHKSFGQVYGSGMEESSVIETKQNDSLLSVSINDKKVDQIYINWIYSRPARQGTDPLHRPNRSLEGAQKIPDELFEEVSSFDNLTTPFSQVFDPEKMRNDRMLHWLMRTTSAPLPSLQDVLTKSGVCFVGDAIHAEPIVGGNGANAAILDGLTLAEAIEREGLDGVSKWYADRYATWTLGVEESQRAITNMHHPSKQLCRNL